MSENLFWDTCVFIRYLIGDESQPYFNDIARFVEEAKAGKRRILYSTISLAEFQLDHFRKSHLTSISDLFEDLGSACIPIEPNPNILIAVSELRSSKSINPNPGDSGRVIATPDAIVMMTALYARDSLGIDDIILHSTDTGSGKGWAGKTVPIIGFERWFPEGSRSHRVQQVCSLRKSLPIHPQPDLLWGNGN